jgi:hypothetical protein
MSIEVFKTNIEDELAAKDLRSFLLHHFPGSKINVDLHDCDKVLRIEGTDLNAGKVVLLAKEKGITCTILN